MSRRCPRRIGVATLLLCSLAACKRPPEAASAAAEAVASSPAASATDIAASAVDAEEIEVHERHAAGDGAVADSPDALMAQAFDDWTASAPYVIEVPSGDAKAGDTVPVVLKPALVMPISNDARILLVEGTPSDSRGEPTAGHASPGNIGVYGFERKGNRWFATRATDSALWTGASGDAGKLTPVDLGHGHWAVTVENGSCWQGYCGMWVQLLGIDRDGERVLASQKLASDSGGATGPCEARPDSEVSTDSAAVGESADPERCFEVAGHWHVVPVEGSDWADFAITFTGHDLVAGKPGHQAELRTVDETLVLRHRGDAYEPVKGRNATHNF